MQTNAKTRTGNRTLVMFDGQAVGLVQSVRASDDYSPEPASGIGDIHVQEYVPTQARHALSVSRMVLNSDKMRALGLTPENGDAALKGLVFDLVVVAKDDGAIIRKYIGCSYASGDIDISAHRIVMASAQFNALDVQGTGI